MLKTDNPSFYHEKLKRGNLKELVDSLDELNWEIVMSRSMEPKTLELFWLKLEALNHLGFHEKVLKLLPQEDAPLKKVEMAGNGDAWLLSYFRVLAQKCLACISLRMTDAAKATLRLMTRLTPKPSEVKGALHEEMKIILVFLKARLLSIEKKYELARKTLSQVVDSNIAHDHSILYCEILHEFGRLHLQLGRFNEARQIFDVLLQAHEELDVMVNYPRTLQSLGFIALVQGNVTRAEEILIKALKLAKDKSHDLSVAISLKVLAEVYWKKGQLNESLASLLQSLEILENRFFMKYLLGIQNQVGIIYLEKGEVEKAREYFIKEIEIYDELQDDFGKFHPLLNLGNSYLEEEKYEEALKWYSRCLRIARETGNKTYSYKLLVNIGIIYKKSGNLLQAMECYQEAIQIMEQLGIVKDLARTYHNMGQIYEMRGELDEALHYNKKSLELRTKDDNMLEQAHAFLAIGKIYRKKGLFEQAKDFFMRSLQIFRENGNRIKTCEVLLLLLLTAIDSGEWGMATEYYDQMRSIERENPLQAVKLWRKCAHAIILKNSPAPVEEGNLFTLGLALLKRAQSLELFKKILEENDTIDFELKSLCVFNACELIILEVQVSGDGNKLTEIKTLLQQIEELAQRQQIYTVLIQIYLLKSKVLLFEGKIDDANHYINMVKDIHVTKGIKNLHSFMQLEEKKFEQLTRKIIDNNPTSRQNAQATLLLELEKFLKASAADKFHLKLVSQDGLTINELEIDETARMNALLKKRIKSPFFD